MTLPAVNLGEFSYETSSGVVTFDATARTKVSCTPQWDDSRRVIKYTEWRIEVTGLVTGPLTSVAATNSFSPDYQLTNMRRILEEPGGILTFTNRGFGGENSPTTLTVNGASGLKDVDWGPRPQLLSWTSVGGASAAQVTWVVTTCVNEYSNNSPGSNQGEIITYQYETTFDHDRDGLGRLTTNGYLEIALTREQAGDRNVVRSAEAYRNKVRPVIPIGYALESDSVTPSKDRRRLDFHYVYVQVPSPLLNGVTRLPLEFSLESSLQDGWTNFHGSLQGTIVLPPGIDKSKMWGYIFFLVLSKCAIRNLGTNRLNNRTMLPQRLRVTDEVFGLSATFSFTFRILGSSLSEIVKNGHLFEPIPGTDFKTWRDSLLGGPWSVYGSSGLSTEAPIDQLIDLGTGTNQDPHPPTFGRQQALGSTVPDPKNGPARPDLVDSEHSWIWFENKFEYSHGTKYETSVAKHRPLGGANNIGTTVVDALTGLGLMKAVAKSIRNIVSNERLRHQRIGIPTYTLKMKGRALRMGLPIPQVDLAAIEGVKVGEGDDEIKQEIIWYVPSTIVSRFDLLLIYASAWEIHYHMTKPLDNQVSPDNYQFKTPGFNT